MSGKDAVGNSVQALASVFYDGLDADGVVREAAFLAGNKSGINLKVRMAAESTPFSLAMVSESTINQMTALLISADGVLENSSAAEFSEKLRSFRKEIDSRQRDLPLYVVYTPSSVWREKLELIRSSINEGGVRRWLPRDPTALRDALTECLIEYEQRSSQQRNRRELGSLNRQLQQRLLDIQDQESGLDQIVGERTSYLVDAERELHRRAQIMRDLVRFIKELSHTESIEEILQLLGSEVRRFHDVRTPILAAVSPEFGARLHYQQARSAVQGRTSMRGLEKGWGSKAVRAPWSQRSSIRLNDKDDQTYLAQELGRPVARTIAVPLAVRAPGITGVGNGKPVSPLLIFEHNLDDPALEQFRDFLLSRLESLSAAIDRVILNSERIAASRLWESTFDGIADPVAVISRDYQILRMNAAFSESVGDETRGDRCYKVLAKRAEPCDGCRLHQVVETTNSARWQVRQALETRTRIFSVNSYPIRLNDSDERGVETVIHHYVDSTRSLDLKGHAIQGEKMAAIGLMAGNIAHELNNPLTGLRSLAQVLSKDDRYPETVVRDLREIEMAAERSSAIIRDLLEFARADDREREVISINRIVDQALNMLKTALVDHRVEDRRADEDTVKVEVDPHLLQHVIFNIVNNACQAMRDPGVIEIATREVAGVIELEIRDTGPGIPEDVIARVFEPFFTTKTAGQGTGLGLSVSRWVVETFGGTVEVANRSDRSGASFCVRLPKADRKSERKER